MDKKRFWKKKGVTILSVLVLAGLICAGLLLSGSSPSAPAEGTNERVEAHLASMGINDAVFEGTEENPYIPGLRYWLYSSEAAGADLYFSPDSGALVKVCYNEEETKPGTVGVQSVTTVTDAQREAKVLDHVAKCLGGSLLGELVVTKRSYNNLYYDYEVREFYSGQQTGTVVTLHVRGNGEIISCLLTYSEIYGKENGSVVLLDTRLVMEEQDARAVALEAIEALVSENQGTLLTDTVLVAYEACGAQRSYVVTVDVQFLQDGTAGYRAYVDACTGEVWNLDWTQ